MIAAAQTCIEKDREPKRVEFIVGDPFMPLSQRGDVYLFSQILAKLSAKKDLKIVQNCQIAMNNTSSHLLIFDLLVTRT